MPLKAKIDEEIVFGPDISLKEWAELKTLQRKEGFCVKMICCDSPGHLRTSKNGLQFFYHKVKPDSCTWKPESAQHEEMKYAIYQICKSEGWQVVTEESPSHDDNFIPDVFAVKNNRRIAFEVQFSKISPEVLDVRERKYSQAGIESYWLLYDFFGSLEVNYSDTISNTIQIPEENPFTIDQDFLLKFEKYYFIIKKIRSIGIEDSGKTLFFSNRNSVSIDTWVRCCLSGEYLKYLENGAQAILQKVILFEKWIPVVEKINEKTTTLRSLQRKTIEDLKEYFLFIRQDDSQNLQHRLDELHDLLSQIILKKNANYIKSKDLFDIQKKSDICFQQIEEIENLLKNYSQPELKYRQLHHEIIKEAQNKCNKSFQQIIVKKKKTEHDTISSGQKIVFQFSQILPLENHWLIASSGHKYQNPGGCKWPLVERDAIEFERKGYGKIVEEYVRAPDS